MKEKAESRFRLFLFQPFAQGFDRRARQQVAPFVFGVAGVAFHPMPTQRVLFVQMVDFLP